MMIGTEAGGILMMMGVRTVMGVPVVLKYHPCQQKGTRKRGACPQPAHERGRLTGSVLMPGMQNKLAEQNK